MLRSALRKAHTTISALQNELLEHDNTLKQVRVQLSCRSCPRSK